MSDHLCPLLIVNLTGLVLWLLGDDPTLAGFGAVLTVVACVLLIKDEVKHQVNRRRT